MGGWCSRRKDDALKRDELAGEKKDENVWVEPMMGSIRVSHRVDRQTCETLWQKSLYSRLLSQGSLGRQSSADSLDYRTRSAGVFGIVFELESLERPECSELCATKQPQHSGATPNEHHFAALNSNFAPKVCLVNFVFFLWRHRWRSMGVF